MPALLEALEDGRKVTLCFAVTTNAEEFKSFANTYMEESGAGNGYDAYWVHFDAQIIQTDAIPPNTVTRLKHDLITRMRNAILDARLAGQPQAGITFWGQPLPPRQRPTQGDMFRTLLSQGATERIEGRVVADHGDTLDIISLHDEGASGRPLPNATIVTIPAEHAMKIPDWRSARRS